MRRRSGAQGGLLDLQVPLAKSILAYAERFPRAKEALFADPAQVEFVRLIASFADEEFASTFKVQKTYTREEIHAGVGGDTSSYLTTRTSAPPSSAAPRSRRPGRRPMSSGGQEAWTHLTT